MQIIINNKKAFFDYEILEKVEAGIVLMGWEVKSLKAGHANISSAYVKERNGELYLFSTRIPMWKTSANVEKGQEERERKLLLKKREIINITAKSKQDRLTIVPLEIIKNDRGVIKVIIALVKGKRKYDKRQKIKERELSRRIENDRKTFNL